MTRCNSCRLDVEPKVVFYSGLGWHMYLCPRCGGHLARTFNLVERGRGKALGKCVGAFGDRRQP